MSKNKKIIYAIICIIIIAGVIVTATMKLNFSREYSEGKRIDAYIGKAVNLEEFKQLTEEVFEEENVKVQEIEIFSDMVAITVDTTTDDQLEQLVQKINEKYGKELTKDSLTIVDVPHTRLRDIVKPYKVPVLIVAVLILLYEAVRYRKLGTVKVLLNTILQILIWEAVYFSIIAIARLPITVFTVPIGLAVAVIVFIILINKYEEELSKTNEASEN